MRNRLLHVLDSSIFGNTRTIRVFGAWQEPASAR
jgi:hypothetical protein